MTRDEAVEKLASKWHRMGLNGTLDALRIAAADALAIVAKTHGGQEPDEWSADDLGVKP